MDRIRYLHALLPQLVVQRLQALGSLPPPAFPFVSVFLHELPAPLAFVADHLRPEYHGLRHLLMPLPQVIFAVDGLQPQRQLVVGERGA